MNFRRVIGTSWRFWALSYYVSTPLGKFGFGPFIVFDHLSLNFSYLDMSLFIYFIAVVVYAQQKIKQLCFETTQRLLFCFFYFFYRQQRRM